MSALSGEMVLENCRVVDGTGSPAMENMVIAIDRSSGNILRVDSTESVGEFMLPSGSDVLDLEGYTVTVSYTHLDVYKRQP